MSSSTTQVRTLALVLGEFSTNSNKYGALGHGGQIAIDGAIDEGIAAAQLARDHRSAGRCEQRDGSSA